MKRSVDMIILSGFHLGNRNSQVAALQQYLHQIQPKKIIINGNFIDAAIRQDSHLAILRTLTQMAEEGTTIHFMADNLHLALEAYPEFYHRNISFEQELCLTLKHKKYLFLNNNFTKATSKTFAEKAIGKALAENCDYIVCGHDCLPKMKCVDTAEHRIVYMHSGNWQEHLSALEYQWGCWSLYEYEEQSHSSALERMDMVWGASDIAVAEDKLMLTY